MSMRDIGERGEQLALGFLIDLGYDYIDSNFVCKAGELDLIMTDGDYLVFVEVKLRASNAYGDPVEFVTAGKRQKLRKTAQWWMLQNKHITGQPRFDVIGISAPNGGHGDVKINHIVNAF